MNLIRKFLYRSPRLKTECPMDLIVGDAVILGTCLSVSESGVRGTFFDPVTSGMEGLLSIYSGDRSIQVPAIVYSVSELEARIRLQPASSLEQDAIRDFIKLLEGR